jgi:hypothetical protein
MDDLVQWLRAQLDEDERIARAATLGPWVQSGIGDYGWTVTFGRPGAGVETADTEQGLADADFIAAHNPARVLREIDAKRGIVRAYETAVAAFNDTGPAMADYDRLTGSVSSLRGSLELLAAVYADRPGYRKEWRP